MCFLSSADFEHAPLRGLHEEGAVSMRFGLCQPQIIPFSNVKSPRKHRLFVKRSKNRAVREKNGLSAAFSCFFLKEDFHFSLKGCILYG